jgi:hypothetical protein
MYFRGDNTLESCSGSRPLSLQAFPFQLWICSNFCIMNTQLLKPFLLLFLLFLLSYSVHFDELILTQLIIDFNTFNQGIMGR